MLAYTFEVATMAQGWLVAVGGIGSHPFHLVVGSRARGKAVGHEHIEHICIGEALAVGTSHFARLELVAHLLLLFALLEL